MGEKVKWPHHVLKLASKIQLVMRSIYVHFGSEEEA